MIGVLLLLQGCAGPPAHDVEVCRDYITRLCIPMVCPSVIPLFQTGLSCEAMLLNKSGCSNDEFVFGAAPSRERFLACRAPLLRAGQGSQTHPNCEDVVESFAVCPEVKRLMEGLK